MENSRVPLATHLMQHTLRSLCTDSQWVYAVFWRILPRNFPPPKWETGGGILERRRANKRNWILVWEDGYCDFGACAGRRLSSTMGDQPNTAGGGEPCVDPPTVLPSITSSCMEYILKPDEGLQPDLFFKMSHDVYNYGEGLMGKVASDLGHKWIYKSAAGSDHANLVSHSPPWHNTMGPFPRTWEAQFTAGIETIALVAVREGLLQLGSTSKVAEDGNRVLELQKKVNYLQMIPGVLLPHPSSTPIAASFPLPSDDWKHNLPIPASAPYSVTMDDSWNLGDHLERRLSWNGTSTTLIPPQQQQCPHLGEVAYEELNTGQGSWPNNAFLNPSLFDALPSSSSANLILENNSTDSMAIANMLSLNPFALSSLGEMGINGGYGLIPSESAASSALNIQQVSCTLNGPAAAAAASSSVLTRSSSTPGPTERKRKNIADALPSWWTQL